MFTVELRIEVRGRMGESSERAGLARELSRGLFAPLQIDRLPFLLFSATVDIMFGVLLKVVEGGWVEQLAVAQQGSGSA
jgi:hypothetical protein